jgi:hypothetical protein
VLGGVFAANIMLYLAVDYARDPVLQCFGNEYCRLPIAMSIELFQAVNLPMVALVLTSLVCFVVAPIDFLAHPPVNVYE